ncbi:PEP-CTERM sorting domain-containing protein, partial [Arthrospira platensis SPKY1]|nr:PEP-CTERM sorting domain-containing protein [Arthrospira platensis SPKY1]
PPYPVPVSSGFFGLVSDTAFTTVTLQQVARGGVLDDMSMDNVRFSPLSTPTPVPEPTSLALLGLGLAGLGFLRRRRT